MDIFSPRDSRSVNWSTIIMFALGFWLSGSLIFDFLVVPGMLTSGMMNEPSFASTGYLIFGTFNHLELLFAATILAGCLVYHYGYGLSSKVNFKSVGNASILLIIALAYTYVFTPQMSSLGMPLDMFTVAPDSAPAMTMMHLAYWTLEAVKLIAATALLRVFYRNSCVLG
ncbi:MAG: hypothetical protein AAFQ80_22335 [Cyanobacteria bacterium J06621_8]